MKISELVYENECISYLQDKEKEIDNISLDPFKLTSGTLFIALRRKSYKIEDLKCHLESKSGLTVVCDENLALDEKKIDVIRVKNLRKISAYIYSRFYKINYDKLTFIGVTGTNGKTTTATLIERLIMNIGTVGFIGTGKIRINGLEISDPLYSMTTPDVDLLYKTLKEMENRGCKYIVMEASSHALYFDKLAPIFFKVSLFTNLSREHGDFHRSEEEYFRAKFKLFSQSKIGIFNLDDSHSRHAFFEHMGEKYSVAISSPGDVTGCDVSLLSPSKSEFIYREKSVIFKVELPIGGIYNIYNALMAIKCALVLSVSAAEIKSTLKTMTLIDGRGETVSERPRIIIDYAHTPTAIESELFFLKSQLLSGQKLIALFGCGGERDREKRAEMAKNAEKYSDLLIISSDNSRGESQMQIFKDILKGISKKEKARVISSRKKAIIYAINSASESDTVVIIGKGHERYNQDKKGKAPFDERVIIKEELERLGYSV